MTGTEIDKQKAEKTVLRTLLSAWVTSPLQELIPQHRIVYVNRKREFQGIRFASHWGSHLSIHFLLLTNFIIITEKTIKTLNDSFNDVTHSLVQLKSPRVFCASNHRRPMMSCASRALIAVTLDWSMNCSSQGTLVIWHVNQFCLIPVILLISTRLLSVYLGAHTTWMFSMRDITWERYLWKKNKGKSNGVARDFMFVFRANRTTQMNCVGTGANWYQSKIKRNLSKHILILSEQQLLHYPHEQQFISLG